MHMPGALTDTLGRSQEGEKARYYTRVDFTHMIALEQFVSRQHQTFLSLSVIA